MQLVISSRVDEICTETVSTYHIPRGLKHLRLSDIPFSSEHLCAALSTLQRFVLSVVESFFPQTQLWFKINVKTSLLSMGNRRAETGVPPSHFKPLCLESQPNLRSTRFWNTPEQHSWWKIPELPYLNHSWNGKVLTNSQSSHAPINNGSKQRAP